MTLHDATRRDFLKVTLALGASAVLPGAVLAQSYPTKPIRLICPWPAGGSTDIVLRAFAESAGKILGVTMVVDNKPGAGGTLGAVELMNARPDGYTLSQLPNGIFRVPHMQKVAFDPLAHITYIACLTSYTFGLVARADSPIHSISELIKYAKAHPGKLTYGSTGMGTTPHLVMEEFALRAGIKLQHIPFKGSTEGIQALLGGHVMLHSDGTGWASQVEAGRFRLLATYGKDRSKRWPQVPTLRELGFETVSDSPFGVGGPKGLDPSIVKILQDAFRKTLQDPSVLKVLEKYDQSALYLDSAQYTAFAQKTFVAEKETIARLGLAMKGR